MRFYPARCLRTILFFAAFFTLATLLFYLRVPSDAPKHELNDPDLRGAVPRGIEPILEANNAPAASEVEKISWEPVNELENPPDKPGERGKPVILTGEEAEKASKFVNQNGFNTYISDLIAYNRSIPDIRHNECKNKLYRPNLPSASIVIPFFNEHFSTLIRTVDSSIMRGHPKLIKEFVLVDDGSTRPFLGKQLDDYIEQHYPKDFVRVIRLKNRVGLIKARIAGAEVSIGSVLIFLDSHCEASKNWLPPLLDLIAQDYRAVPCPMIDVVSHSDFTYRAQDEGKRGAFDWELFYKRLPMLPESLKHPEEPFYNPVMAGGLFAISAKWFEELGYYDPELAIWGGEQYELSFKVWMCGGTMYEVPCSRVGHIYRGSPTDFPAVPGDYVGRNYKRVAEVWMDEYKEHVYKRRPHYRSIDPGDLSDRLAIRQRLGCKSFGWFLKEVAFDIIKTYPLVEPIPGAIGDLRPVVKPSYCVDSSGGDMTSPLRLKPCSGDPSQKFQYGTFRHDIRKVDGNECFDRAGGNQSPLTLFSCHGGLGAQHWSVMPIDKNLSNPVQIRHVPSTSCLEYNYQSQLLVTGSCHTLNKDQHWIWSKLQLSDAVLSEV